MTEEMLMALQYAVVGVGGLIGVVLIVVMGVFRGRHLREAPVRAGTVSMLWVVALALVYTGTMVLMVALLGVVRGKGAKVAGAEDMVLFNGIDAMVKLAIFVLAVTMLGFGGVMAGGIRGLGLGIG
jgi:hypothetical protein